MLIVLTYQRPQLLRKCLTRVLDMSVPKQVLLSVVVVDNDQSPAAASAAAGDFVVHYVHEPKNGVARARNTGLKAALALSPSHIGFVDDDSMVEKHWLQAMYETLLKHKADIVTSTSGYCFDGAVPKWMGAYYAQLLYLGPKRPKTPFFTSQAHTGSVLFKASCIRQEGLTHLFDETLSHGYGEDTLFFKQLRQKGAKILWIPQILVREVVTNERARIRWLMQRHVRMGLSDAQVQTRLKKRASSARLCSLWLSAKKMLRACAELFLLFLSPFPPFPGAKFILVRVGCGWARAWGHLWGACVS